MLHIQKCMYLLKNKTHWNIKDNDNFEFDILSVLYLEN